MSNDASPFFIRPHRFDDPDPDDGVFPELDGEHRILLAAGEKLLWYDRLQVAGYLVGPGGDRELRWVLPQPADVIVTDQRLAYVCDGGDLAAAHPADLPTGARARHRARPGWPRGRLVTGQVRWQWPSRLHLLPGTPTPAERARPTSQPTTGVRPAGGALANSRPLGGDPANGRPVGGEPGGPRSNGGPVPGLRSTTQPAGLRPGTGARRRSGGGSSNGGPTVDARTAASQRGGPPTPDDHLLIVCDALRSTRQPCLALTATGQQPARTARDLATVVRRAIARFRLAHPDTVDLAPPERDVLRSRAGVGAFADELADPERGMVMPGALVVEFLDRDDYYRWSPGRPPEGRGVTPGVHSR